MQMPTFFLSHPKLSAIWIRSYFLKEFLEFISKHHIGLYRDPKTMDRF